MSRQFWIASGHHLLDHDASGYLVATAEYWRVYLARPEIVPPADACLIERALYDRLRRDPYAGVPAEEVAHIGDRDARENWRYFLAYRDHVRAHPTLEAAYVAFARGKSPTLPPLFINQLVHVIARNMLDGEQDPYVWRAAEMLFRAQRLTMRDGVMLLADEEQIDLAVPMVDHASPLTTLFEDARAEQLEILGPASEASYAARSDAHDLVMDFRHGQRARAAFATVIERWVRHLLGVAVTVKPIERLEAQWQWYVGLDADGTRIGNALWAGETSEVAGTERIVALFQLDFGEARDVDDKVAGAPVYLILGMTSGQTIRVKPQNLVVGLPLRTMARA
jgi:Family of unknown function (DUF6352)